MFFIADETVCVIPHYFLLKAKQISSLMVIQLLDYQGHYLVRIGKKSSPLLHGFLLKDLPNRNSLCLSLMA